MSSPTLDELCAELLRFYEVAHESLMVVWPAVEAVSMALLEYEELDTNGFFDSIAGYDLYAPIRDVQRAHELAGVPQKFKTGGRKVQTH